MMSPMCPNVPGRSPGSAGVAVSIRVGQRYLSNRGPRNRGLELRHPAAAPETGPAGWGGRTRTTASGIVRDWASRYLAAQRKAADRAQGACTVGSGTQIPDAVV